MSAPPSQEVVDAIEAGTSEIIRRVEVYETDGVTPWYPDTSMEFDRLVDGTVNVDYSRDERRTLDLTLLNDDGLLRPSPDSGLWYDKVLKVFRGITYPVSLSPPTIALLESSGGNSASQFRAQLLGLGFTRVDIQLNATTSPTVIDYDIVLSATGTNASVKAALLQEIYNNGGKIVTISVNNDGAVVPHITSTSTAIAGSTWGVKPTATDNPMAGTFALETASPTAAGKIVTTISGAAQRVALWNTSDVAASISTNDQGGRWFDLHLPNASGAQAAKLLKAGILWLQNFLPTASWEVQMGEYVIDSLEEDNFPHQLKVVGRDYTKRCLTSKFEKATSFDIGTSLYDMIRGIASNAGITKFKLPVMTETTGTTITAERGTTRWEIMKKAADTFGYEIYFDNQGYLTMRKYQDPSFGALAATFLTGPTGNLVSYSRSVNDSRLYNHVCVYGDPADGEETRLPYFGEAKNTEPSSPTRISRIGDRLYTFASTFFTSDNQAMTTALAYLKIHALESYELEVNSIYYPWLEGGDVVEVLDPDRVSSDPTRFLMDTITYPLGLGPMTMTAKRVTYVGDPDSGFIPDDPDGA